MRSACRDSSMIGSLQSPSPDWPVTTSSESAYGWFQRTRTEPEYPILFVVSYSIVIRCSYFPYNSRTFSWSPLGTIFWIKSGMLKFLLYVINLAKEKTAAILTNIDLGWLNKTVVSQKGFWILMESIGHLWCAWIFTTVAYNTWIFCSGAWIQSRAPKRISGPLFLHFSFYQRKLPLWIFKLEVNEYPSWISAKGAK